MKSVKMIPVALSIIGVIFLTGCFRQKKTTESNSTTDIVSDPNSVHASTKKENSQPPTVTVWVHGTRLITRFAPQEFFFSPPGMKAVTEIPEHYHMYKTAKKLSSLDPKRFQMENFYLFGWSGRLSFNARKKAAEELYAALVKLTEEYKNLYNITPTFRIITHSHGGNVALNLPAIKSEEAPFIVSELILLACPVQEKTKGFISDPLFKRVYSFFSRGELLQVLDPQGLYRENDHYPLFSKRIFPDNPKLSQAEIKIHGRSILHVEFLLGHFAYKLPEMLNALDKEKVAQDKNTAKSANNDYVIIDLKKKHNRKQNRRNTRKIVLI